MTKFTHLIDSFVPDNYKLRLTPDPIQLTFSGQVEITGNLTQESKSITLHANELKIWSAQIDGQAVDDIRTHQDTTTIELVTSNSLARGDHIISIVFDGKITESMHGIYPCNFEYQGQTDRLIATQFESHYAREAFPCIDEPAAKAVFELTLVTPVGLTVVSNTEITSQTSANNFVTTTFAPTPKMSTYLLAFVVGKLASKTSSTKGGISISAYATPDNIEHTKFALDTAVRALEFLQDYFEIPYPLTKCDLIALPEFDAGAMENWGCITFRESAILVDPKNTNIHNKQYVAMVVAHELAHQWFGNLVTMSWWTDLWLNEGFASWIEYLVTDKLFPEWQMWSQFITDETTVALKLDALQHTHPVVVPIDNPDEITTIFDSISYSKGACMIRMAHDYVGADNFREGLVDYLEKHAYHNATTDDLWQALTGSSFKDVGKLMQAWLTQPGFPLIKINSEGNSLVIKQKRFSMTNTEDTTVWPIPLYANVGLPMDLLDQPSITLEDKNYTSSLLLNNDAAGFMRVAYPPTFTPRLVDSIAKKQISATNRLGVINDTFELAKAGQTRSLDALYLIQACEYEDDAIVWQALAGHLMSLHQLLGNRGLSNSLKLFTRNFSEVQAARLGWVTQPGESYLDSMLRPTVLSLATYGNNPRIIQEAIQYFSSMKQTSDIPPDVRGVIYRAAIQSGDTAAFDTLLSLYKTTSFAEELDTINGALCQTENPTQIRQCIDLLTTNSIRQQDLMRWIARLFVNPMASEMTWQWLKVNWRWLADKLKGTMAIPRIPKYAATQLGDEFKQDYEAFFDSVMTAEIERSYQQGLEQITWRTAWAERDGQTIIEFFDQYASKYSNQQ